MENEEVRLTTSDNPFNPFSDWDKWYEFDLMHGYNTCARLASICNISDSLSDEENQKIINEAIKQLEKFGCISKNGDFVEYVEVRA